jgi:transposase
MAENDWKSRRFVLNGILWGLRAGAPWADLTDRYPSFQSCHRRFQQWVRTGVTHPKATASRNRNIGWIPINGNWLFYRS